MALALTSVASVLGVSVERVTQQLRGGTPDWVRSFARVVQLRLSGGTGAHRELALPVDNTCSLPAKPRAARTQRHNGSALPVGTARRTGAVGMPVKRSVIRRCFQSCKTSAWLPVACACSGRLSFLERFQCGSTRNRRHSRRGNTIAEIHASFRAKRLTAMRWCSVISTGLPRYEERPPRSTVSYW